VVSLKGIGLRFEDDGGDEVGGSSGLTKGTVDRL